MVAVAAAASKSNGGDTGTREAVAAAVRGSWGTFCTVAKQALAATDLPGMEVSQVADSVLEAIRSRTQAYHAVDRADVATRLRWHAQPTHGLFD